MRADRANGSGNRDDAVPSTGAYSAARYQRATEYAPVAFAPTVAGGIGNSYWIDDRYYFFCVAEADAAGAIVERPKLFDAHAGKARAVIDPDVLASLIAADANDAGAAGLATARYDMADADSLIVGIGARSFHIALGDGSGGPALTRTEAPGIAAPALYSPDGKLAIVVSGHTISVTDRATGTTRQLAPDGERHFAYGVAAESGLSPVSVRRMPTPVGLWSPDSEWFVTQRVDERHMPESGIVQHVAPGGSPLPLLFRVSRPDSALATLHYVAFHLPSGGSWSSAERPLIDRAFTPFTDKHCWFAGGCFYFLDWNRAATVVTLVEMRLDDGSLRSVLEERVASGWIDVHPTAHAQPMIRILPDSGEILWWSERDGHGHLYLYDLRTGVLKAQVTRGEWMVREIVHIDTDKRRILFLASGFDDDRDRGNRRLCAVSLDGDDVATLLRDGDIVAASDPVYGIDQNRPFRLPYAPRGASPKGTHIVVQSGAVNRASRTMMFDIASGTSTEFARGDVDRVWTAPKPQPFEFLAADGATPLYGTLYFPSDFDPARSYPLADYIYPGPHMNWLARRLPTLSAMTAQSVAELGIVTMVVETRGTPNRGRAFHQAGRGRMVEPQLSDHVAAVEQLCARHDFLDRDRVGIFGESAGGYATTRAMFDYADVFKVGVAICGPQDYGNYVALWQEKYSGPAGAVERPEETNLAFADKLVGKLLLIHGDMDENVPIAHALALSSALIAAGKDFEQLIVPGASHFVLIESRYALQRLWNFLVRHLIGAEPPAGMPAPWAPADLHRAFMAITRDSW